MDTPKHLPVIGINELVSIGKRAINVPAKIDTGADSSSIWASDIKVKRDGTLVFKLFGEGSPHYTGKIFKRTDYKISSVKNSFGKEQIRYRTYFPVIIASKKIKLLMNLSDRSNNHFKILIGRRSISGKFLVDVTKKAINLPKPETTRKLNKKSTRDPYKFYKKYVKTPQERFMKTAIFTTKNDPSLKLLKPYASKIYYYDEISTSFPKFDRVYFRDPFNDPKNPANKTKLDQLLTNFNFTNKNCKSIDNIAKVNDLFFEDKYRQYKFLGAKFMPKTFLASKTTFKNGQSIAKKRISSRAKDIILEKPPTNLTDEYIIQPRLNIREELRIFVIYGIILPIAAIKSSKTEATKVKIVASRNLTKNETDFINSALQKLPELDFIGIDLALLDDGKPTIIEVNRSPQFLGYKRTTGKNLAITLLSDKKYVKTPKKETKK